MTLSFNFEHLTFLLLHALLVFLQSRGQVCKNLCLPPLRLFSIGDTDETLLLRLLVTSVLLNFTDISGSSSNFSLLDIFSPLGL